MALEMKMPPPLNVSEGNMADEWSKWKQKLYIYLTAAKREEEDDKTKIAILLNLIGDEGIKVFNSFKSESDEEFDSVIEMFETYFQPRKNIIYERFKFYKLTQKRGQPFNEFLTEIKSRAASCEFEEESNMIRDKIVLEISEDVLRERLLAERKLTLEKAIEECKNFELRKVQAADMSKGAQREIDFVKKVAYDKNIKKKQIEKTPTLVYQQCGRCGNKHNKFQCPAYGKRCIKCNIMGHFARKCKSKSVKREPLRKQNCDMINQQENESEEEYYIDEVQTNKNRSNEWLKEVEIAGKTVEMKLDTGAECNIISIEKLNDLRIDRKLIQKSNMTLINYGKTKIKSLGMIILPTKVNGKCVKIKYIVTEIDNKPLFGLNTCTVLGLVNRIDQVKATVELNKEKIIEKNSDIFNGIGRFSGKPYNIKLKIGTIPKAVPARRVAKSIQEKLKIELNRLTKVGVIRKVEGPTDWLQPLVIKEKPNGQLRICLDPKHLNQAICEERFLLPNQQEILSDLEGKEVFSVLDLKEGFYQVELDKQSAELCSFATPYGRYQFCRMPFGLKTAAEVFQRKNTEIFGEIPGVKIYIDDLLIAGTREEHDVILNKVLETARKAGITFNREKFQYKKTEIKILGHWLSEKGIKLDPGRIEAIKNQQTPKDKASLLRYLGMVKYVSKFIPDLARISAPLRELTKIDAVWEWKDEQVEAYNNLNKLLSSEPILTHYDHKRPLTIQTDASKDGLGSVLLQDGKPISYVSRALTKTEKMYAQIEKEMLAIVFAAEKFHYWIYGKTVMVNTDHKPLVTISKRELDKVPTRLQRMIFRLLKYDLKIEYLEGKKMYIADTLSRAYVVTDVKEDTELNYTIHSLITGLAISEDRKTEIKEEIKKDEDLAKVMQYMEQGWPKKMDKEKKTVKLYGNIRDDLTIYEGLIIYNDAIVIPESLKKKMLKSLHSGHQGMVRTKMRARGLLYWPRITVDIEDMVARCEVCQKFRKANRRQPMIPHVIPELVWMKIAADIATYRNKDYLIVVDYRSKWLEIKQIKGKTAEIIMNELDQIFAIHGIPEELVSDNMPFNSWKFKSLLAERDIKGTTTSPNYPRANGLAERGVATAKSMLGKSSETGEQLIELLREYRSTPIPGIGKSPAEMLMGRQLRGRIPTARNHLMPKQASKDEIERKMMSRQAMQKKYYDRGTKVLPPVKSGEWVRQRSEGKWREGKVITKAETPRSLIVETEKGRMVRRNREHLMTIKKEETCEKAEEKFKGGHYNLRDRGKIRPPKRFT